MSGLLFDNQLHQDMRARLARFDREDIDRSELRPAAVAVVVAKDPQSGVASIVITLRAQGLRRHSGQYALPGGRIDPGETAQEAAFRETEEELGLTLTQDDLLGQLDDFPTRSGFRISPFVFWCPEITKLRPEPEEVARVIFIPLPQLAAPDIPTLEQGHDNAAQILSIHLPVLGHQIYAPTAAILYQFREIALFDRTTRSAHFEQPDFAWK